MQHTTCDGHLATYDMQRAAADHTEDAKSAVRRAEQRSAALRSSCLREELVLELAHELPQSARRADDDVRPAVQLPLLYIGAQDRDGPARAVQPVPVKTWIGPGADVGRSVAVPTQMWAN